MQRIYRPIILSHPACQFVFYTTHLYHFPKVHSLAKLVNCRNYILYVITAARVTVVRQNSSCSVAVTGVGNITLKMREIHSTPAEHCLTLSRAVPRSSRKNCEQY